jgi:sec-independent protein translocase protein TatB
MFDVGWSELMVIAVVAIVVIGPKDLPRVMRVVGQWSGKVKRMGRDFQRQFNEALREAELDDVRKDVEALGKGLSQDVAKARTEIDKQMTIATPATTSPPAALAPVPEAVPTAMPTAPAAPGAETAPTAAPPSPEPAPANAGEVKP